MATITTFEDLEIWQQARELNIKIAPLLERLKEDKCYRLKVQLDGSAGSVMNNIVEGFERNGNKEFVQFLAISKGSLGEVRSQLYSALDRNYIEKEKHDAFQEECKFLAGKIAGFISYLNKTEFKGNKFKR